MNLIEQLRREEGTARFAYECSLGFWTIGVGRNIDKRSGAGLSPDEIDYLLANDVARVTAEIKANLPWAAQLDEPRFAVLAGMAFQLGLKGMLEFKKTLDAVRKQRYTDAAFFMLDSKWARQTPARAARMALQMRSGQWQLTP